MERDHGRIVSVSTRTLGSVLDGDHAAGATSLVLFDAGDFDETGGTLSINGATLAYALVDDDAATITLTDPLPAAALDGDFVAAWDTLYDTASTVKTAMVQLDGDDDNPDPIECFVPHFLVDKLADGDRGGPGESVPIGYDEDEDEWQILDVRGLADASGAGVKFYTEKPAYTVTADGDQALTLTYVPEPDSEHIIVNGATLTQDKYTLNGRSLTIPGRTAGEVIDRKYAYRKAPITPPISGGGGSSLPSVIVRWHLDDPAGTTQLADSGPDASHPLTIYAGTPQLQQPAPPHGPATASCHFDGATGLYDTTLSGSSAQQGGYCNNRNTFSFGCWFKTTAVPSSGAYMGLVTREAANHSPGQSDRDFSLMLDSTGKLQIWLFNSAGQQATVKSLTALNDGSWHRAFASFDGSTVRLIVDGAEVASTPLAGPMMSSVGSQPVFVGSAGLYTVPNYWRYTGDLADVVLCGAAITAADAAAELA